MTHVRGSVAIATRHWGACLAEKWKIIVKTSFEDEEALNIKFEYKLDALYSDYASIAESQNEAGNGNAWNIIRLNEFPQKGLITYLTYGLSGFYLYQDNDLRNRVRHELSFTIDKKFATYDPVPELNHVADMILEGGENVMQDDLVEYGFFDSLPAPEGLRFSAAIIAHPYWLGEVQNEITDKPYPCHIMEVIPLHKQEAKLAHQDIKKFAELIDSGKLDILDLDRKPAV